jgi:hypothetical protein
MTINAFALPIDDVDIGAGDEHELPQCALPNFSFAWCPTTWSNTHAFYKVTIRASEKFSLTFHDNIHRRELNPNCGAALLGCRFSTHNFICSKTKHTRHDNTVA